MLLLRRAFSAPKRLAFSTQTNASSQNHSVCEYGKTARRLWIDGKTRFIVQGMTGRQGTLHTRECIKYGTRVVGGVHPSKGGETFLDLPIFSSCLEARKKTDAEASLLFVPASYAKNAILDAINAEFKLVVAITEGIPQWDMVEIKHRLLNQNITRLLGPNCPGLIRPGHAKVGIMPAEIHKPGAVGVVSRSGTLTYEAVSQLTAQNLGQSLVVGIGGDPISGTSFVDVVEQLLEDAETSAIVLIGEIGGDSEEQAAAFIARYYEQRPDIKRKPIVSYIAGKTAPPGKRMGHAGAIISGSTGGAESKIAALRSAGVEVVELPTQIGAKMRSMLIAN